MRADSVFQYKVKMKIWIGYGIAGIVIKKVVSCEYAVSVAVLEWRENLF